MTILDQKAKNNSQPHHSFLLWIPIFIILLIKSDAVVASLFALDWKLLIIGTIFAILPMIFLFSFSFLFSAKGQLVYLFALDVILSLIFIADIVYGRAFGHLIGVSMIFAADAVRDIGDSIIALMNWTDFLMLVDLPFILILARKVNPTKGTIKRKMLFVVTAVLSFLAVCYQFNALQDLQMLANYRLKPYLMSPVGNHMADIYHAIDDQTDKLDSSETAEIANWLQENKKLQVPAKEYAQLEGMINGKNVIMIQWESLENILIGRSYYGQEITPNINRLLGSSIYFNNVHTQVRDGNTSDAELLVLASMYPASSGSVFLNFSGNRYIALPQLLREAGYTTIALHGNDGRFWNRSAVYPALGFDQFVTKADFADQTISGMGILDESLFSQTITEIEKRDRTKAPYFLFSITLTSHLPYELDMTRRYLDLPGDNMTNDYLQSICYTDKVFGDFYNTLAQKGLLDNTVLILYGDHEGIHKYADTSLEDNNYKVPFIIHIPGMVGFEVTKIGGQVDMMPTLAFLLGIDLQEYAGSVMGENLLGSASGTVILPSGEILGDSGSDTMKHLLPAQNIADNIIKGNYFALSK